jgi:hypothetical protein
VRIATIVVVENREFDDHKKRPHGSAVVHEGCEALAVSLDLYTIEDLETLAWTSGSPVQVLLTQAVRQFVTNAVTAGTVAAHGDVCRAGNRLDNQEAYR